MKIDVLNKGSVSLVDHMGTDLTVVNAARVSFDKESEWDYDVEGMKKVCILNGTGQVLLLHMQDFIVNDLILMHSGRYRSMQMLLVKLLILFSPNVGAF